MPVTFSLLSETLCNERLKWITLLNALQSFLNNWVFSSFDQESRYVYQWFQCYYSGYSYWYFKKLRRKVQIKILDTIKYFQTSANLFNVFISNIFPTIIMSEVEFRILTWKNKRPFFLKKQDVLILFSSFSFPRHWFLES